MLGRYIELIFYKAYADLRVETERTYLGFLWWIFEPMMFMATFYLVFGVMLGNSDPNYVPFLMTGLIPWQWTKSCLSHGTFTILGHGHLMEQVKLPKIIFPIILLVTDTVKFLFILALLIIFVWGYGLPIGKAYLALLVLLLVQLLFTAAFTFLLAAVVPFMPDLRIVVENILQAIFFMSGIFFAASALPQQYHCVFYLNPFAVLIRDYRTIMIENQWPHWDALGILALISLVGIVLSALLIRRFDHLYPKIRT
jgi:lipopolysaccharide transport system permease protein